MKVRSRLLTLVVLLCFGTATSSFGFDDGSPEAMIADTIVARPACFVATVIGSAFFVVALPFAALSKSVEETAEALVVKPARATFTRPLGEFSSLQ